MTEHDQNQPTADAESTQSADSETSGTSIDSPHPDPGDARESWYRRLQRWTVASPERTANLIVAIAALVIAGVAAFAAVQSLNVSSQALSDQTASDKMARDLEIRAFASKVVLWPEATAASGKADLFPSILHVQNLNNEPLGATSIIIGVNDDVQFGSDGFAFTDKFSWREAYTLGRMAPCSETVIDNGNGSVGRDPGLFFIDNNDLMWYQSYSGLLVQIQLSPSQLSGFYNDLADAPVFPRSRVVSKLLSGCS